MTFRKANRLGRRDLLNGWETEGNSDAGGDPGDWLYPTSGASDQDADQFGLGGSRGLLDDVRGPDGRYDEGSYDQRPGSGVAGFRAESGDPTWQREIDFRQALVRFMKDGDLDRFTAELRQLFPESRQAVRARIEEAAMQLTVDPFRGPGGLQLKWYFEGDPAIDNAIVEFNALPSVTASDAEAFARTLKGANEVLDDDVRSLLVSTLGIYDFYWNDARLDEDAVKILDRLIHGDDVERCRELAFSGDLLSLLQLGGEGLVASGRVQFTVGDPAEDEALVMRLMKGTAEQGVAIEVDGYLPNETLRLETGPRASIVGGGSAPSLDTLGQDADLMNAVRQVFHRALGLRCDQLIAGFRKPDLEGVGAERRKLDPLMQLVSDRVFGAEHDAFAIEERIASTVASRRMSRIEAVLRRMPIEERGWLDFRLSAIATAEEDHGSPP